MRIYKDQKSRSCPLCKPYKRGITPKFKANELHLRKISAQEIEAGRSTAWKYSF